MSIKNRFATAVATASLLAGLFGSAFVPSVSAAIVESPSTVLPKYTTLIEGGDVHQAGTAKSFGFESSNSDDLAVDADTWIDVALYSAGASGAGTTGYDFTAPKNSNVELKAVSSNPLVNIGWGYDNDTTDGDADLFVDAVDCTGDITVGTSSTYKSIKGTNGPGADSDETFHLCLAGETDTTAATSTITVTVNGVVASTFTVTAVGPLASLTASITDTYKYIAEGNAYRNSWFTVIGKDANGTTINGSDDSVWNGGIYLYGWEGNPENKQGDVIDQLGGGMSGDYSYVIGDGSAEIYFDLYDNTCAEESGTGEGDGDAGTSYSLKFADDSSDADVVSNAIAITCTLNSDGARVTALTPETLTGARNYNEGSSGNSYATDDLVGLVATVVDADGKPLGDGADFVDFSWDVDSADSLLDATIGYEDELPWYSRKVIGGDFIAATLDPVVSRDGSFTYVITAYNSDLGADDAVEKSFTNKYTVAQGANGVLTRTRNAAKTIAVFTADMGEDAAYDIVTFFVELKSGKVVEYNRLSNADGVATLTLAKRNTKIVVFADYLGATNQVTARFR